ncbi:hypothetical protein YC2023_060204 [Brassica napus]
MINPGFLAEVKKLLPLFPFQLWNHPSRRKKKKSAKKARTDKSAEISAKSVEENIDKSTKFLEKLIAKGLEVPKEMMDQLARDEAKYDKEINDMEVGDTKHIHFALSLLMSNLNV